MSHQMEDQNICDYQKYLVSEEKKSSAIQKYERDIRAFSERVGERSEDKDLVLKWKEELCRKKYAAATINSMLSAVNGFFGFMGWTELKLKFLKIQNRIFRDQEKDLCRREYERLLSATRGQGKERLLLLMETICGTGILFTIKKQNIVSRAIFFTEKGNALSRQQIWQEMKNLCREDGVEISKVFPHNLRHL